MSRRLSATLIVLFFLTVGDAFAQVDPPSPGPVYIVQQGDTLSTIALQFGITIDSLIETNLLTDPNALSVGQGLVIPGLEGVSGTLSTVQVRFGESLRSLSRRYQIPEPFLVRLNRLTSPAQLFVGIPLILPETDSDSSFMGRQQLQPGESLFELAVRHNENPWTILRTNALSGAWRTAPLDVLYLAEALADGPGNLPGGIGGVEIPDLPLVQGRTARINVETPSPLELAGSLAMIDLRNGRSIDRPLHFFNGQNGFAVALQGVHAMAAPGLVPLTISGTLPDGSRFSHTQLVPLREGGYIFDLPLQVDPKTLDPDVTGPEDLEWFELMQGATGEKAWSGLFESPSPFGCGYTSRFGSRRSYNGSPYNFFHTGLDFCGGTGLEIRAPAPGEVRFAGPLVVRGNATVIDHGHGVFTAYMHQSEILVEVGERVETGQAIGLVGATGRVTGAHLHWEIWVGAVQVDPIQWLETTFP